MGELKDIVTDPIYQRATGDQRDKILDDFISRRLSIAPEIVAQLPTELIDGVREAIKTKYNSGLLGGSEATIGPPSVPTPKPPEPSLMDVAATGLKQGLKALPGTALAPFAMAKAVGEGEAKTQKRREDLYAALGTPLSPVQKGLETLARGAFLGGVIDRSEKPRSLESTLLDILDVTGTAAGLAAITSNASKLSRAGRALLSIQEALPSLSEKEAQIFNAIKGNIRTAAEGAPKVEESAAGLPKAVPELAPKEMPTIRTYPPEGAPTGMPPIDRRARGPGVVPPEGIDRRSIGQFNIDRFDDPGVQLILREQETDPVFQQKLIAARRGMIPDADLKELASHLDMTPGDLLKLQPGSVLNAEQALRANQMLGGIAKSSDLLAEKYVAALEAGDAAAATSALNDMRELIGHNAEIAIKTRAVATELGRALRQQRIRIEKVSAVERLLTRAAVTGDGVISPEKVEDIMQKLIAAKKAGIDPSVIIIQQLKPTMVEKLIEMATAFKLTHPISFLRNFSGNSAAVMTRYTEKAAQGPIDILYSKIKGVPRSRFSGEAPAFAMGLRKATHDAVSTFWQMLKTDSFQHASKGIEIERAPAIGGKVGQAIRFPFRVLGATDEMFKTLLRRGELYSKAFRQAAQEGLDGLARTRRMDELIANPPKGWLREIEKATLEYTYQSDLGKLGTQMEGLRNAYGGIFKLVLPFFKTPVNIFKFIAQRTPGLGVLPISDIKGYSGSRNFMAIRGGGPAAVEALTRQAVGTMTAGLLTWMGSEGLITGSGPDPKTERNRLDALMRTGWRPHSFHFGDQYVSYLGFDPMASVLSTAADMAQQFSRVGTAPTAEAMANLGWKIVQNMTDQPYLTGLADFIDAARDERKMAKWIDNFSASFVPTGVGFAARTIDPVIRNPRGPVQAIETRLPGLSQRVPPKVDAFGRDRTRSRVPLLSTDTKNPIDAELLRLSDSIGFEVGLQGQRLNGRKLENDEYAVIAKWAGDRLLPQLQKTLESAQYQEASDYKRKRKIQDIKRDVAAKVRDEFMVPIELRALGIDGLLDPLPDDERKLVEKRLRIRLESRKYQDGDDASKKAKLLERIGEYHPELIGGTK